MIDENNTPAAAAAEQQLREALGDLVLQSHIMSVGLVILLF